MFALLKLSQKGDITSYKIKLKVQVPLVIKSILYIVIYVYSP